VLGQQGGEEAHTLTVAQTPSHTHTISAVNNGAAGGTNIPGAGVTLGSGYGAGGTAVNVYSSAAPTVAMAPLAATGGQPHENRMPFLALNYCIALQGVFPSQN